MPWAHDAAGLAASCSGGRCAAVVDSQGRLFTIGAGKSGALGHGDTSKRAVGRPVKALTSQWVHAAAFGADFMLVLAGWRPPAGKGRCSGGGGGRGKAAAALAPETPPAAAAAGEEEAAGLHSPRAAGFRYAVEPPPSPRSPTQRGSSFSRGEAPGTPVTGRRGSDNVASSSSGSGGFARLRGRSGREQRREEREEEQRVGRGRRRHGGGMELPDAEGMMSRRQRWMAEPLLGPSQFTPPGSDDDEGGGGGSGGREVAYLLRRQVKVRQG